MCDYVSECQVALRQRSKMSSLHTYILGYSNETSGLCGSLLLGTGFVGAIASGLLVERTVKMVETAKVKTTENANPLTGFIKMSPINFIWDWSHN